MYRYELHLHTSETSKCGHVPAADQIKTYHALGYTGVCVTDHLHTVQIAHFNVADDWTTVVDRYLAGYRAAKAAGDALGMDVIFGVELRFPENDSDYLIYGIDEQWLYDHPWITKMDHQSFFDRFKDDVLIIHAHPYRNGNDEVFWDCVHGVEVVNCNPRHDNRNALALALCQAHPYLYRTVGSDAHQIGDEGRAAILTEECIRDSYQLKDVITSGRYRNWCCPEFTDILKESEAYPMFDSMIIGQITLDHNIDFDGREEFINGGAVTFSGYAAAATGRSVAVVPKGNTKVIDPFRVFADSKVEKVFAVESETYTEMENTYFTADRERRRSLNTKGIEPYKASEIPQEPARIYHLGGLVAGDFSGEFVRACAARGDVGLDVQGMMRYRNDDGSLELRDWPEKKEILPLIRYLKTDAAEAEMLTGTSDREKAAFMLCEWGAREVLITHNTEAIVCDGEKIYRAKLCPRNLTGRTGRGDTTFAGYLCERLDHDIPTALEFAAALVSLKMETPGPFKGTREDVLAYIEQFYH